MKKMLATAAIALLASVGALASHHSIANYAADTTIRMKGTVVAFERVNPHSIIFLDEKKEDGRTQRWAVEGPAVSQLDRRNIQKDFLKVGDIIEICGLAMKEGPQSQRALPSGLSGRAINGVIVVTPDGKMRSWSPYGFLDKCVPPDEQSSLVK
jgi:hypothetical protein